MSLVSISDQGEEVNKGKRIKRILIFLVYAERIG